MFIQTGYRNNCVIYRCTPCIYYLWNKSLLKKRWLPNIRNCMWPSTRPHCWHVFASLDTSVVTVARLQPVQPRNRGSIPGKKKIYFSFPKVQNASGANPVSYSRVGSNRRGVKLTNLTYIWPSSGMSGALFNPRDLINCTGINFTLLCLFHILNTLGSTPETGYLVWGF